MADRRRSERLRCRKQPATPILPADILFEILAWLPAKTILKFKCVCREWRRLISQKNHDLAVEQLRRRNPSLASSGSISLSLRTNALVYHGFDGTFAQIPLPNLPPVLSIRSVEAYSNGLCCLLCSYGPPPHLAYLCNPFLPVQGELVPLYPVKGNLQSFTPFFFERNGTTRTLGLAFDPTASFAYKLVQFNCICSYTRALPFLKAEGKCEFRIILYSSDSGRWVESRSMVSTHTLLFYTREHCWDRFYGGGKVYWHCSKFLVYYDIEGDAAGSIMLPNSTGFHIFHQELELREGLLMCRRVVKTTTCVEVWALTGNTEEEGPWECRVRVTLREVMLKGLKGWLNKVTGEVPEQAWIYEDEERGDCLQVMVHVGEWFPRLQVLHYDIFRKALVTQRGRIYENPPSWMINRGLTFRHHGSLFDVPKRRLKH